MESIKLKKCSVKLNRLSFIGVNPNIIQEQILDQRVRKCAVVLRRCKEIKKVHMRPVVKPSGGLILRRCIILLPRLNLVRSEISTPTEGSLISEGEGRENSNVRTNDWVQKTQRWK